MSVIAGIDTSGIEARKNNDEASENHLNLNLLEIVPPAANSDLKTETSFLKLSAENADSKFDAVDLSKETVLSKAAQLDAAPARASNDATPSAADMAARKAEEASLYPELTLTRQATDALADKSNPKQSWENANVLFHLAEQQVEKYIEYQGGISKIFQNSNQLAEELYKALDEFKQGKRGFDTPNYPEKTLQEERLREQLKNFGSKKDQLGAIRGESGMELRTAIFNIFNTEEKELLAEMDHGLNKVELFSSIKLQHALAANKFAVENNDLNARVLSENILKSIAATDPDTYKSSPEIHGLLLQSERGEPMDLSEGKAHATAFAEEAKKIIITRVSSVDALFNPDARKQASEQALGLMVASLAANEKVARKIWTSWDESKNFAVLFSAAEAAFAEQKKPAVR